MRGMTGVGNKDIYLEVDEDLCTGCGLCEERAPENMAMNDDGFAARVIKQPASESESESCKEAVEYCPMGGLMETEPGESEDAA
jgi:ferredoxin